MNPGDSEHPLPRTDAAPHAGRLASGALRLTGTVLSVKALRKGEGVSYGYAHRAPADTRVALVTGGYAQGVVRSLGGRVSVRVGGGLHPIVGRVAMDVCVVDIGEAPVSPGDEVVFLGDPDAGEPAIDAWAEATGLTADEIAAAVDGRSSGPAATGRGPVLTVDLEAFAANLATVRERISPAELMLVVKDDAYAHGLVPIVRRAWAEGVRWFGAFDVPTGCAVRAALGGDARIFAWLAFGDDDVRDALDAGLELGIGNRELLEEVARAASGAQIARVHLKIDSGLHRNGVRPEEWPGFVARARQLELAGAIEVVGVWSHISEASDADDDAQRAAFDLAFAQAEAAGLRPSLRHLAASAASFARPEFRYDLCRVGAFCFGIRPAGGPGDAELGIRPIATLRAPVVRRQDGGVSVGVGALDGLPSSLAGRFRVRTPDGPREVSEIGPTQTRVAEWTPSSGGSDGNEWVGVFGADAEASATDLAELIGTIGEEIALRVSPRVPREYRGG